MRFRKYLQNAGLVLAVVFSPSFAAAQTCQEQFASLFGFWRDATLQEVTECLEAGVELNSVSERGSTAFLNALRSSRNPDIIKALIDAGADVNLAMGEGFGPLFIAKSPDIIQILFDAGADLEARVTGGLLPGLTPLLLAVHNYGNGPESLINEQFAVIRLFVALGADITAQDDRGYSVLHIAASNTDTQKYNTTELIVFLVEHGASLNTMSYPNASSEGHTFSPLQIALLYGADAEDEALTLIELGADISQLVGRLNASTISLVLCRNTQFTRDLYGRQSIILDLLLERGADPSVIDRYGLSAIDRASRAECYSDIRLFQKYGYMDRDQPTYE